ncbi:MAG: hypothetical protein M5U26_13295 [Planctomycetota bacterium]|nr:hypothetical protein [Planctomycetota bacterium]
MQAELLEHVEPSRRDRLYREIKRIVDEVEAVDRALEPIGEAMAVDEALGEITDLILDELRHGKRKSRRMAVAA